MFTLSTGNLANYISMVGKGSFKGTSAVMWIDLNTSTGSAKMDALMFDADFQTMYGSPYTPKFVLFYSQNMYLMMDPDSAGLRLLVTVKFSTKITDGSVKTLNVTKLTYSVKTVLTSSDLFSHDIDTPNAISFALRDDSVSPP